MQESDFSFAEDLIQDPVDASASVEPTKTSVDEPARASTDEPVKADVEDPAQASVDEPAKASADDLAQASVDDPARASAEEPVKASAEPAKASVDEPAKASAESAKAPAKASADNLAKPSAKELAARVRDEAPPAQRKPSMRQLRNGTGISGALSKKSKSDESDGGDDSPGGSRLNLQLYSGLHATEELILDLTVVSSTKPIKYVGKPQSYDEAIAGARPPPRAPPPPRVAAAVALATARGAELGASRMALAAEAERSASSASGGGRMRKPRFYDSLGLGESAGEDWGLGDVDALLGIFSTALGPETKPQANVRRSMQGRLVGDAVSDDADDEGEYSPFAEFYNRGVEEHKDADPPDESAATGPAKPWLASERVTVTERACVRALLADVAEDAAPLSDVEALRWIRFTNCDVAAAAQARREHVAWRLRDAVDDVEREWDAEPQHVRAALEALYPYEPRRATDALGRPVSFFRTARLNKKLMQDCGISTARLARHHVLRLERLRKRREADASKPGFQHDPTLGVCEIYDVAGATLNLFYKSFDEIIAIAKVNEQRYPGLVTCTIVINAPATFPFCYRVVKPFLPAETQKRIEVTSGDPWLRLSKIFHDPEFSLGYAQR